jgi:hypothetical protein
MASRILLSSVSLAILAGCASVPPGNAPAAALAKPAASQQVALSGPVTGSNLPARIDPRTGKPITSYPLQSVSREELDTTGQTNIADALRMLLPNVR